jgi:hypothetical protein
MNSFHKDFLAPKSNCDAITVHVQSVLATTETLPTTYTHIVPWDIGDILALSQGSSVGIQLHKLGFYVSSLQAVPTARLWKRKERLCLL